MELQDVGIYLGGAVVILLLLFISALLVRSMGGGIKGRRGQRLSVSEYYDIDKLRRLVLVKRDGTEHLMLIGPHQDVLIETGIAAGAGLGMPDEAPLLRRPQKAAAASPAENEPLPLDTLRPVSTRMAPRPALSERAPNIRNVEPDGPRLAAIRASFDQE